MRSMMADYDPSDTLVQAVKHADETLTNIFVTHPGYVDEELLNSSSLTYNREKEVQVLVNPHTKAWLQSQNVRLVSYEDIR